MAAMTDAAAQPDPLAPLAAAVVAAARRLGAQGLIAATEGNLSVRLESGDLLVTPAGRRKDELAPADLVVVPLVPDPDGGAKAFDGPRPSSDIAIHRAVYAARPDVVAVAHAHLPAAMALTLAGEIPDAAALPETALLLGSVPFVPFDEPGSDTLAAAIAEAVVEGPGRPPAVALLERHGAVALGGEADMGGDAVRRRVAGINQAVDRLELLEVLCRTWRDALLVVAARRALGRDAILPAPSPRPGAPAGGQGRTTS